MEKVYLLTQLSLFEFRPEITTKIFRDKESADEEFKQFVKDAMTDMSELDDKDVVIESDENYFEIYQDGRAAENGITIMLEEKNIE